LARACLWLTKKLPAGLESRVLRLTLLAPDIVEMSLGGRQSAQMTLAGLMRPFEVGWTEQRKSNFCCKNSTFVSAQGELRVR
jgi:hypothetical protein